MNATATMAPAPQHMRALERANRVRLARASLKRDIAAGQVSVVDVVLDPPQEAEGMALGELLLSQRRWGHSRSQKFLAAIPLSESKSIGSMTERQRRAFAARFAALAPVPGARSRRADLVEAARS